MISVKGIVIPASWDAKGNVTEVAIATYHEEEYFVEEMSLVNKLQKLLRKEVEVTGIIKNRGGKKIINVQKFCEG